MQCNARKYSKIGGNLNAIHCNAINQSKIWSTLSGIKWNSIKHSKIMRILSTTPTVQWNIMHWNTVQCGEFWML